MSADDPSTSYMRYVDKRLTFTVRRKREKNQKIVWASKEIYTLRDFFRRDRQASHSLLSINVHLRAVNVWIAGDVTVTWQHWRLKGENWRLFDKKGSHRTSRANFEHSSARASYSRGRNESIVSGIQVVHSIIKTLLPLRCLLDHTSFHACSGFTFTGWQ